jgi:hypothetical protein
MPISYLLLIAESGGERLLGHDGALPCVQIAYDFWWQDVAHINKAVREQLGMEITTLSCFQIFGNEGVAGSRFYYAVERLDENVGLSEGVGWVDADSLESIEEREVGWRWLESKKGDVVPWYRHGWRSSALDWAKGVARSNGLRLLSEPEQLRSWERSSLWRLNTVEGRYYFKAVPPIFAHEPALTQLLGKLNKNWFAPALAIAPQHGWLIMGDAGPQTLLGDKDAAKWEAALRVYAEMQISLIPATSQLLAIGLPDRRVNGFGERVNKLLADTDALRSGPAGLSIEEIERLRGQLGELQDAIELLASSSIPVSLEHGDFAPGQIVTGDDGKYRFIDWSDSSVAFPFLSMLFFWAELKGEFENYQDVRLRLRDAYLEPWTALRPKAELDLLFEAAMRVAPFHHALIYYCDVLPGMKAKWEMERMLQYYLRLAWRTE